MMAGWGYRLTGKFRRKSRHCSGRAHERTPLRGALPATVAAATILMLGCSAAPQGAVFRARLSPVPVDSATSAVITGSGSVTATLSGRSLSVQGTYEGMRSAATMARIHRGPRGARGPAVFDLTVTKATNDSLGGTFMLTPEQVEDVRRGRFYVQVHSEKATEGNLWGWLLP